MVSAHESLSPAVDASSHPSVPYNKPYLTGKEFTYIEEAFRNKQLSGNGLFTQKCHKWLEENTGGKKAFLTPSGTAALEMAAILSNVGPGDEVIMPSFTFVTTASAFALRGAVPVFVDIDEDTLNIGPDQILTAITGKTKAIVPVHYAGVSCEMDEICKIARHHELTVIEDAAHAVLGTYKTEPVGNKGDLVAFSFHETKNISSGEGGALLVNREDLIDKAHIVWEKGTNRREFFLGKSDKYTWKELGSSFPSSELTAAFLYAQMEEAYSITAKRVDIWQQYHAGLEGLENKGLLRRPPGIGDRERNGHIYYIMLPSEDVRNRLLHYLNGLGTTAVFHYIPLHSSPGGMKYGRAAGDLLVTDKVSKCILRLPIWVELPSETVSMIIEQVHSFFQD